MASSLLKDKAEIVMGQSPPGDTCNTAGIGIPLLNGPTEYGPYHPYPVQFTTDGRKRAKPGDLLFCVRGSTTGRMNWANQEFAIGRGVAAIRHKKKPELQPLVRAVIEYALPGLLAQATGSTFPNVSSDQLSGIWWPSFEAHEERAIAHVLGTLDEKIENNRRINETLEAMARAVFKSWFVEHVQNGLPKGWRESSISEVAENPRRGVQPKQINPATPYIGLEHMPRHCITLSDWGHADELASNKFEFKRGEILFGKLRPYFHKVGVAPLDGVCSTDILVIRPKGPEWFGFVLGHVSSIELVDHTNAASTGTKMPRTNWNDISRFAVALPPKSLAAEYSERTRPLIERIMANIHESHALASLREALFPKLISGQVRVGARKRYEPERVTT